MQGAWAQAGEISEQLLGEGRRIQFVKIFDLKRRHTFEAFELCN